MLLLTATSSVRLPPPRLSAAVAALPTAECAALFADGAPLARDAFGDRLRALEFGEMPMGPKGMVKPDDAELADATVDALWEFLAAGSAELDAAACIARLQEMSLDENRDGAVGEGPDSLVWKEFAKGLGAAPFERW